LINAVKSIETTVIAIVIDLSRPWEIMNHLE